MTTVSAATDKTGDPAARYDKYIEKIFEHRYIDVTHSGRARRTEPESLARHFAGVIALAFAGVIALAGLAA